MGKPVNIEIDPTQPPDIYIFDIVFECKARNIDLISDEDIKDYGTFSTGMETMDIDNMTQMVSANLSIEKMATHRNKGYELRYCHAEDVLKIYEYTQHYLNRWVAIIGSGGSLNGSGAPIDDLVTLDKFCSEVYEQAKFYDNVKLTSLEQRYGVNVGFNAIRSMFVGSDASDKENKLADTVAKHRKGFSELLREYQVRKDPSFGSINKSKLNG